MGNISQTIDAIINERKQRLKIIEDEIKKVETSESAVNAFKEAQHKLNFETLGISKDIADKIGNISFSDYPSFSLSVEFQKPVCQLYHIR